MIHQHLVLIIHNHHQHLLVNKHLCLLLLPTITQMVVVVVKTVLHEKYNNAQLVEQQYQSTINDTKHQLNVKCNEYNKLQSEYIEQQQRHADLTVLSNKYINDIQLYESQLHDATQRYNTVQQE